MNSLVRKASWLLVFVLVLFDATTTIIAATTDVFKVGQKVQVRFLNVLPNSSSFTIHCKSKDDDLGTHVIAASSNYEFDFNINFFGTTLFFCSVNWTGGKVTFDAYKASRDQNRCPNFCKWEVRPEGIIGYTTTSLKADITIPWIKP